MTIAFRVPVTICPVPTATPLGKWPFSPPHSPLVELETENRASDDFARQVDLAVSRLPQFVENALKKDGWRIRVGRIMTDIFSPPERDPLPGNKSWAEVPGICVGRRKQIGIAEHCFQPLYALQLDSWVMREVKEDPRKVLPDMPVPEGLALGKLVIPEKVLRHEVGHAMDAIAGRVSCSNEFVEAYVEDVEKMTPEAKAAMDYFIQPDAEGIPSPGGLHETFADGFAALLGDGSTPKKEFEFCFPRALGVIAKWFKAFQQPPAIIKE